MVKQEQILIIEPTNELKFKGPFTAPVTSYIKLRNPSEHKVCFKIKTTAPKKYCVRPNSGILDPQKMSEIAVSLQPFDYDPDDKSKHKFMVQSIIAPQDGEFNLDTLWKEATPDTLMNSKLKCFFEMPSDTVSTSSTCPLLEKEDPKKRDSLNSANSAENEIQKASLEIARLREELSSVQRENLQLKEDLLNVLQPQQPVQSVFSRSRTNQHTFNEGFQINAIIYLFCGVIIGLMSVLLGIYIF
ncbi:hypothetical protein PGB90_000917 [Kerria lacca]